MPRDDIVVLHYNLLLPIQVMVELIKIRFNILYYIIIYDPCRSRKQIETLWQSKTNVANFLFPPQTNNKTTCPFTNAVSGKLRCVLMN